MKQFVILLTMVILGVAIYAMIAGPGDDSVLGSAKEVWRQEIDIRTRQP
ncbi:MAG: hypothetical protein LBT26_03385 [Clostridiales Family XIII bacterium]|jgi:hypothetical protein|nr:hypothetical protein [Clostridiales Family XIII bacterium]